MPARFRPSPPDERGREVRLDAAQAAVLDLPDAASAAVLGAPGTGKTTVLVEAVAERVLGRGWGTDQVLVLTTARAAATRLRDRIALRLGVPTAGPLARTVNSLAFELVRAAARVDGAPPPRLITGGEQDADFAMLLAGHAEDGTGPAWPEVLAPEVRALHRFRSELRELLMRATEYDVTPTRLRALAAEHGHPEWAAAADFAAEFRAVTALRDEARYDLAEILSEATGIVASASPGERIAALRLVLVDDLQEATESTLRLLRALADRGIAVLAFGDPDVAANAFRGGEPDALGRLASVLGRPVHTLVLSTAHRHGPALRALTGRITERIGTAMAGAQRVAVAGAEDDERPIARIEAASPAKQWAAIARELREAHLERGLPWSALAVVVRSRSWIAPIARALAHADVPTRTLAGGTALRDDRAARALLTLVGVGTGSMPLDAESATELLLGPFGGFDRLGLRRLRIALRAEEVAGGGSRPADELVVEALAEPGRFATIDHRIGRQAQKLADTLAALRASDGTTEELLWLAWERSGLARRWHDLAVGGGITAAEANRDLDGIVALFTAAKRYVERFPFTPPNDFIETVLTAEVAEDTLSPQTGDDAVLVTTPPGTLGLEFDTVVVAALQDGAWPDLRLRGSLLHPQQLVRAVTGIDSGTLDDRRQVLGDELRMLALAVSRASRRVVFAAVGNDDESASPFFGLLPPDAPLLDSARVRPLSLRGSVGELRRRLVAGNAERRASATTLAALAAEAVAGASPDEWHGLLPPSTTGPLFEGDETVPVSPSSMQKLLDSPMDWFLERVAGGDSGIHANVGTIVHWAMETVPDPTPEALWAAVESRWDELVFDAPWLAARQRQLVRGFTDALADYLGDFARAGKTLVGAESRFSLTVDRAQLNGSIDRVERSADGSVVIVDLKTGSPVTAAAQIAEHPQLGAYQLAYAEGILDEALAPHGEHAAGGAKLLFVKQGLRDKRYREAVQQAMDAQQLERFRERVRAAASLIAAAEFDGAAELAAFGTDTSRLRLHRVPAVSWGEGTRD